MSVDVGVGLVVLVAGRAVGWAGAGARCALRAPELVLESLDPGVVPVDGATTEPCRQG